MKLFAEHFTILGVIKCNYGHVTGHKLLFDRMVPIQYLQLLNNNYYNAFIGTLYALSIEIMTLTLKVTETGCHTQWEWTLFLRIQSSKSKKPLDNS